MGQSDLNNQNRGTGSSSHRVRSPRSAADQEAAAKKVRQTPAGTGSKRTYASSSSSSRNSSVSGTRRTGSSSGLSGSKSSYSAKRKKKQSSSLPVYIAAGAAALLVLLGAVAAVRHFGGSAKNGRTVETVTQEPAETFPQDAIRQYAFLDVSALTGEPAVLPETKSAEESTSESGTAETSESVPASGVSVVALQGLTPDEIREQVSALYQWGMTLHNEKADVGSTVKPTVDANETTEAATLGDAENPDSSPQEGLEEDKALQEISVVDTIQVPDLVDLRLTELLSQIAKEDQSAVPLSSSASAEASEAQASGEAAGTEETPAETKLYVLSLDDLSEEIAETVAYASDMWYVKPKGGSIGSYDKDSDKFIMEGSKAGYEVDREALSQSILTAVSERAFEENIEVPGHELSADDATAAAEYKIIGTYTTKTTSNSVRNKNISLACKAINGTILAPGEEFSFNNAVGQRTEERGFGAAAAYNDGEVVQEIGGGICQVSTTLYNAVLRAGLKTVKRQSHTFEPSYVTPGMDATVSWGGPDYRFANVTANPEYSVSSNYSIGIKASYYDRTVTVSIYGRPVLKDGYTLELKSEKVKEIDVVRKLIEPGSDKTPTTGTRGSQWTTNLIVRKNGEIVENKLDHNTYYSGHIEYYTDQPETTAAPSTEASSEVLPSIEVPTETAPILDSEPQAPQYETGVNGGPGVVISGGSETQNAGPGAATEAQTEAQTTASPGPVETAPVTAAQTEAPAAPVVIPDTAAAAGPGISDVPSL